MAKDRTTPPDNCQPPYTPDPEFPQDPIPRIIPAYGISLLAGAPNVGKTALLAGMARNFRDGRLDLRASAHTPGCHRRDQRRPQLGARHGRVVQAGRVRRRAPLLDGRRPQLRPAHLRRKFERTQRLAEFVAKLQLPPESLLLVDPVSLFLGGNLLDYDSCAVACHEIRQMLNYQLLHHDRARAHSGKLKADKKDRYVRLQDQILGSDRHLRVLRHPDVSRRARGNRQELLHVRVALPHGPARVLLPGAGRAGAVRALLGRRRGELHAGADPAARGWHRDHARRAYAS